MASRAAQTAGSSPGSTMPVTGVHSPVVGALDQQHLLTATDHRGDPGQPKRVRGRPCDAGRRTNSGDRASGQWCLEREPDGAPLPRDVHLEPARRQRVRGDRSFGAQVGEPDRGADGLAPGRAGDLAGRPPSRSSSSPPHSIGSGPRGRTTPAAAEDRPRPSGRGTPRARPGPGTACRPSARWRRPARPRPGCSRGELAREGAEPLLQPQRLDRVVAGVGTPAPPSPNSASYTAGASATGTVSSQPGSPT